MRGYVLSCLLVFLGRQHASACVLRFTNVVCYTTLENTMCCGTILNINIVTVIFWNSTYIKRAYIHHTRIHTPHSHTYTTFAYIHHIHHTHIHTPHSHTYTTLT